jgi:hypothetical protein
MDADKCKKWANNFLCSRVIKIGAAGCATLMSLVMEWVRLAGLAGCRLCPCRGLHTCIRRVQYWERQTQRERERIECVYMRGRYCISTLLVRFHPPFVDAHCHWNIFNNNNNNIALCARSILCALRIWWNRSLTHCGVRPLSVRAAHPDAPSCKIDSLLSWRTLLLVDCARSL